MQLTRNEIFDKLKDILITMEVGNRDAILSATEATRLIEELGLTSVAMLYLVIAIEESFGIQFDNLGIEDFRTVGIAIDYIEAKLK